MDPISRQRTWDAFFNTITIMGEKLLIVILVIWSPIHHPRPILQCLRQVSGLNPLAPCQIGDGAAQLEDAVEQRTGDALLVFRDDAWRTGAGSHRVTIIPAWAGEWCNTKAVNLDRCYSYVAGVIFAQVVNPLTHRIIRTTGTAPSVKLIP